MSLGKYGIKLSGGESIVTRVNDVGKSIGVLKLMDTSSDGTTALQANFSKIKGMFAVEIRFKFLYSLNNLSVAVGEGVSTLAKVDISALGEVSVSNGAEKKIFESTAKVNSWVTLRFCYNPKTSRADVRFNSEIYKNLIPYPDYSMNGVDSLLITTNIGSPTVLIDYYLLEKGSDLDAEVRPIEPPYIDAPVSHAVKGKINICYNGEYKYFDYEPVTRNNRVLIPFRRAFEMFDMEVSYDSGEKSATGKNSGYEVKILKGSNLATVNGVEYKLDVTPVIIENSFYVPIRFLSQAIGKKVYWDNETRTVIIND